MVILLFGISNVGKTVTGQLLAKKLGYHFLDMDAEIKRIYQTTLEQFMKDNPFPYERGKLKGQLLADLVNGAKEDTIIAVSPIFYARFFNRILEKEQVIALELQDTAEHIFERLVFSDENDVVYEDIPYKEKYRVHYMRDIQDDINLNKRLFKKIKHRYFIDNKPVEQVADELVLLLHEIMIWQNSTKLIDAPSLTLLDWQLALELDGQAYSFTLTELGDGMQEFTAGPVRWQVQLVQEENSLQLSSSLFNSGATAVRLGQLTLLQSTALRLGEPEDQLVVLPWQTGQSLQQVFRLGDPQDPGLARIKLQFYNQTKKTAFQAGFISFQRADSRISYTVKAGQLKSLCAWSDYADWQLLPGESTRLETLRLAWGDDPYQQMEDWAKEVASLLQPTIWEQPPLGYLGWAWTDPINGDEAYDELTLANLDAINQRLAGFGVNYLWTSMTNIQGGLPGNWLKWNRRTIPMGRKAFISEVEKRGFIQGFWIGPFYIADRPELLEQFGDALLRDQAGELLVVVPAWSHGDAGRRPLKKRPRLFALDPTHPKALDFISQVFSTYRDWGVRYYMVDFLEAGAGNAARFPYGSHYDTTKVAGPEAYLTFIKKIRQAAGPDTYLLGSTGPTLLNAGILDAVRTGSDFGEGRPMSPQSFFYPGSYVINDQLFWTGPRYALMNHAANFHTHRRLYLNDSGNVLTVDQPLSLNHARLHATIHAFSGGPSMLGDDLRQISDERLALIKKTLPRPVDLARPLDLFDEPYPSAPAVFWRRIKTSWQDYYLVVAYNLTSGPRSFQLDLRRFGLDPADSWLVYEFWNESFTGTVQAELAFWLEAESVKIFRLTKDNQMPTLLGTDMHLTMGEMDILEASYQEESMTFRLAAWRPAGEKGVAFVRAPAGLRVINFSGLHVAKDGRDQSLVIGVPLNFNENGEARWEIQFAVLKAKATS